MGIAEPSRRAPAGLLRNLIGAPATALPSCSMLREGLGAVVKFRVQLDPFRPALMTSGSAYPGSPKSFQKTRDGAAGSWRSTSSPSSEETTSFTLGPEFVVLGPGWRLGQKVSGPSVVFSPRLADQRLPVSLIGLAVYFRMPSWVVAHAPTAVCRAGDSPTPSPSLPRRGQRPAPCWARTRARRAPTGLLPRLSYGSNREGVHPWRHVENVLRPGELRVPHTKRWATCIGTDGLDDAGAPAATRPRRSIRLADLFYLTVSMARACLTGPGGAAPSACADVRASQPPSRRLRRAIEGQSGRLRESAVGRAGRGCVLRRVSKRRHGRSDGGNRRPSTARYSRALPRRFHSHGSTSSRTGRWAEVRDGRASRRTAFY